MLDSTLPDHAAVACEVMRAIDAADFHRVAALLDDSFQMHYGRRHGRLSPRSSAGSRTRTKH
jgi:hypothetical protein